jgi:2-haloalkanoic acid dehalogenase type II
VLETVSGEFDRFGVLSFDCYGTLIDWETGILAALAPWRARADVALEDEELLALFGECESRIEATSPAPPYPTVLAEALRVMGERCGAPATKVERAAFGASVPGWPAFPDSAEALARLRSRYRLIIVSNVHRAGFAASAERLGVPFDAVITAEDVGAYKPARPHFDALLWEVRARGFEPEQLLHVAQSLFHDHAPAKALGLTTCWIDRRSGRMGTGATPPAADGVTPDWTFPSLAAFAEAAT